MAVTWFSSSYKSKSAVATIYDRNITLNKFACDYIRDCYKVMLGLDYENKLILIKPVSKDLALRGTIDENNLYQITLRASYGRVSNVDFIREVKICLGEVNLKENPKKFRVIYEPSENLLKIDLNEEVI